MMLNHSKQSQQIYVGMVQLVHELDLAHPARRRHRHAELRAEHLDGHVAIVLEVPGTEHDAHTPAPHFAVHGKAVPQ